MSRTELTGMLGHVGRILLAFTLVFTQTVFAEGQNAQNKAESTKAANRQTAAKESALLAAATSQVEESKGEESENAATTERSHGGGPHEGIKVHGHWTIEVRNPDGTLVMHREFENSLTSYGGGELASYLARARTVGQWNVVLSTSTGSTFFLDEPGSSAGAPNPGTVIGTLTVSAPPNGTLLLTGSGTVPSNISITAVASEPSACAPTVAPTSCNVASGTETAGSLGSLPLLTGTSLATAVTVTAGQIIQLSVAISFS